MIDQSGVQDFVTCPVEAIELNVGAVEKLALHLAAHLSDDVEEDVIGEPNQALRTALFVEVGGLLKIEETYFAQFFPCCPGRPQHVVVQRRRFPDLRPLLVEQLLQPDGIPPGAIFSANRPQERLEHGHVARLVAGVCLRVSSVAAARLSRPPAAGLRPCTARTGGVCSSATSRRNSS